MHVALRFKSGSGGLLAGAVQRQRVSQPLDMANGKPLDMGVALEIAGWNRHGPLNVPTPATFFSPLLVKSRLGAV